MRLCRLWWCSSLLLLAEPVISVLATNYSCPTWLYYSNTTHQCECGYQANGVHCDQQTMRVLLTSGYCITYSGQDGLYYGGICPLRYKVNNSDRLFSELPTDPELLEDAMCGTYNRKGFQCAECIDGYGPAVYSLDRACADCSQFSTFSAVCLYLLADFVPITLFFFIVLVFRISITSGPMLGFVMFSQGFSVAIEYDANIYSYFHSHVSEDFRPIVEAMMATFESCNLRFLKAFIPAFCISESLTGIHVMMLSSLASLYPVVLVLISFFLMELHAKNYTLIKLLWKPIGFVVNKTNVKVPASDALIHAFATFILLSSTTNMFSFYAMTENVPIFRSTDHTVYKSVLYFDESVEFLSATHIPFLAIALVQCFFLVVVPSLVLFIYPTRLYRLLSECMSARKQQAIRTFAEALHSSFKDGLKGTRDYRAVAGVLIFCLPLFGLWCLLVKMTVASEYDIDICAFFTLSSLSFLICYARPFKSKVANMSSSYYSILFGVVCLAHYLWMLNLSTTTDTLKGMFLFTIILAQIPVALWIGYKFVSYLYMKFVYCF